MRRAGRPEAGFGLIELLVVMVILAVLAAIAVPVYLNLRGNADTAAERSTAHYAQLYATQYVAAGLSTTYRRSVGTPGSAAYYQAAKENVSNALEVGLEQGSAGANSDGFTNPSSGRDTIVNWNSVYTDLAYVPPAVWITDAAGYRFATFPVAGNATTARYLKGAVIVNFNAGAQRLEVFWVEGDGRRGPSVSYVPLR